MLPAENVRRVMDDFMLAQYDSQNIVTAYRMKSSINLFAHVGFARGEEPLGNIGSIVLQFASFIFDFPIFINLFRHVFRYFPIGLSDWRF